MVHGNRNWPFRTPREAGAVIIDTPAALGRSEISELTYIANCVLIPVLPSSFDVQVTTRFIADLLLLTDFDLPMAVVANRTQQNTKSLEMLMRILAGLEIPTIATAWVSLTESAYSCGSSPVVIRRLRRSVPRQTTTRPTAVSIRHLRL